MIHIGVLVRGAVNHFGTITLVVKPAPVGLRRWSWSSCAHWEPAEHCSVALGVNTNTPPRLVDS